MSEKVETVNRPKAKQTNTASSKPKKVNPATLVQDRPVAKTNSTAVNATFWTLTIALVVGVSAFNQVFEKDFNPIIRLVAVIVGIAVAFGSFMLTNQGRKLLTFSMEAMLELRKIYWPTRKEALQTSLIVVVISVLMSFMFWFFDSVIQTVVNLITTWSF